MTLRQAIARLGDSGLRVEAVSRFYATPCFPAGAGPDYVNAAAVLSGTADPEEVLALLHRIEAKAGRARKQRWGSRVLDLDLLAVGASVRPDAAEVQRWMALPPDTQRVAAPDRLLLPHPRLHERAFVLVPLRDVAADWRHPLLGLTVAQMADRLDPAERNAVRAI